MLRLSEQALEDPTIKDALERLTKALFDLNMAAQQYIIKQEKAEQAADASG